ncbi:MAG: DsrE family protein [Bacteroidota bacterium]|nr:DsrE family protein [Bacteroidota bacterium]
MKKIFLPLLVMSAILMSKQAKSQSYHGAEATKTHYKALYFLDDADPKKIKMTLRNIDNALDDVRLKGKLEVELVVFGDGVGVYEKANPYEEALLALQKKGVLLTQCSNTVRERHIDKETLFSFINYVPSGNGEIIIRQADGWSVVHP